MKKAVLLSLLVGAFMGLALSCSTSRDVDTADIQSKKDVPMVEGPRISADKLKAMLDEHDVVIIDLRIDEHWDQSDNKIAGAIRRDPDRIDSWKGEIAKNRTVVTYCA
ncbi:MAG: hypothetical protein R6V55_15440 [Desulfovermiculus sp.]